MKFKFFKRLKRRLARHARWAGIIGLFAIVFGVGIWFASIYEGPEIQKIDFGNATTSKEAQLMSKATYEDALALFDEGKKEEAQKIMRRLAPLSTVTKTPQGNGAAHLWVAQQDLGISKDNRELMFLEQFPLEYCKTQPSQPAKIFRKEGEINQATRHLEIAVKLSPELNDAYLLLATMRILQEKRDEALKVLMEGITHQNEIHDSLLIALANTTTYEGDELALKEWAWLGFTTFGHEVAGRGRGSLSQRLGYAAYALLLGKYEVVDLVEKRIKRDFSEGPQSEKAQQIVQSLKMAVPYFKSISQLDASHASGDYTTAAKSLVEALTARPENLILIQAVQSVSQKMPNLRPKIKQWLEDSGIDKVVKSGESTARLHLLMSHLSEQPKLKKKYLELAVTESPHDPEILLEWVQLQLKEPNPAYAKLRGILDEVETNLPHHSPQLAHVYWAQGIVLFHLQEIPESIGRLERALSLNSEKKEIHALLVQAYEKVGHSELAQVHKSEMSAKNHPVNK